MPLDGFLVGCLPELHRAQGIYFWIYFAFAHENSGGSTNFVSNCEFSRLKLHLFGNVFMRTFVKTSSNPDFQDASCRICSK